MMDPARATALSVALERDEKFEKGDALPLFFHQIYFWDPQPAQQLGRDGHPKVGGLIPDMGLPRRMWAGGRLKAHSPLRVGIQAEKRSFSESAVRKTGRSGPLAFVTLRHEYYQDGLLCLTEWQDLVYREDVDTRAEQPAAPLAPTDEQSTRPAHFSSTLLFRYSALTFNGHRIHYDQPYARQIEGYDGLVVHGPLLAQLLILFVEDTKGPLSDFTFRASSPLMHTETAILCRRGEDMWVRGPDGRQCMTARATLASE